MTEADHCIHVVVRRPGRHGYVSYAYSPDHPEYDEVLVMTGVSPGRIGLYVLLPPCRRPTTGAATA